MTKSLMLLCAGSGKRAGKELNKVLTLVLNKPLFLYSLEKFIDASFDEYIVVTTSKDYGYIKEITDGLNVPVKVVVGSSTRQLSVIEGLKEVTKDRVYIHDAARPLVSLQDIQALKDVDDNYQCGGLCSRMKDTVRTLDNHQTLNRDKLVSMSTPQFFNKELFELIINNKEDITDELSLFEDKKMSLVFETSCNMKYTYPEDLTIISSLIKNRDYKIGKSLDYHPFSKTGTLVLGGVKFNDYPKLEAHSDGDVVVHAVTEALMGALNLGDLGTYFPDSDNSYKDIDSFKLLQVIINKMNELNYHISNIDVMVYLIKPVLKDYKQQMSFNLSLVCHTNHICVKAATLNKRGLISLEEGIGAEAICLIEKNN